MIVTSLRTHDTHLVHAIVAGDAYFCLLHLTELLFLAEAAPYLLHQRCQVVKFILARGFQAE